MNIYSVPPYEYENPISPSLNRSPSDCSLTTTNNIGLTGQLVPSENHIFGKSPSPEQSEKVILRMKVFVGIGTCRRGSSGGLANVARHLDFLFLFHLILNFHI